MSTAADQLTAWRRPGISQVRISPPQPSSSPTGGAASASQAIIVAAPIQVQATAAAQTLSQTGYQGAWSATGQYSAGSLVELGGEIYIAIAPNANMTPPNAAFWTAVSAVSFSGAWSAATTYTIGDIVNVGAALYIATATSTNENPTTTSGYWQLLTGTSTYLGAWSSSTNYSVGQQVSYNGNFYVAIVANTNVAPAPTGSTDWVLLGTSNTLIGVYAGGTTYTTGMEVTNGGNIWQALQATTGNAPPTPPATSVYWQLMGPTTLSSVPDGSGVYASTSAGTSYRPTTNPLTSVDAGANATINIASFNMNVSNRSISSPVSYNSGSITTLSYGTLYYVYCNDPDFAGGAVTYLATTTKTNVLSGSGYLFVGSIFTAVSGGGTTTGNNDGGSGAQYGNNVVVYPTAETNTSWTNPANSFDGNPASSSLCGTASGQLILSGFSSMVLPGCSGITLTVDLQTGGAAGKFTTLLYSTNGGSSFTSFATINGTVARTVYSVSIGTNLNPANIQFKMELDMGWTTGDDTLYQVWLLETF